MDEFTSAGPPSKKLEPKLIDTEGNWTCKTCYSKNIPGDRVCQVCKAAAPDEVK